MKLRAKNGNARLVAIAGSLVIAGLVYAGSQVSDWHSRRYANLTGQVDQNENPWEPSNLYGYADFSNLNVFNNNAGGESVLAWTSNSTLRSQVSAQICGSPSPTEACASARPLSVELRKKIEESRQELLSGKRTLGNCWDVTMPVTEACLLAFDDVSYAHTYMSDDDNNVVEYTPAAGVYSSPVRGEDGRPNACHGDVLPNGALVHACTRGYSFGTNSMVAPQCFRGNMCGCSSRGNGRPGITPSEFCAVAKRIKTMNSGSHPCRDGGGLVLWDSVVRDGYTAGTASADIASLGTDSTKPYNCNCEGATCHPCAGNISHAKINAGVWYCDSGGGGTETEILVRPRQHAKK